MTTPNFNHLAVPRDFQDIVYSLGSGEIGAAFINDNLRWDAVACHGLLEKTPCSTEISAFREHEVQSLTITINRPI